MELAADSRRPSVPPHSSETFTSRRDDEVQPLATGKESTFASDNSMIEAKSRSKGATPEPGV